jgi:hypothetical protein
MKILFHENSLCERGTAVALFDYAFFCKRIFNIDSYICYNEFNSSNHPSAIEKFTNEFNIVKSYKDLNDLQNIIDEINPDAFFMEKGGKYDNIISKTCKNWIHAIAPCMKSDVYGDRFAMGSKWLSKISNNEIDYVPYMVNLPNHTENFRKELGIPDDAIVFGRNGGRDTFDILFVKEAIKEILKHRNDVYFLFQNTDKFYEHDRIIYLPTSSDLNVKVKFINTTNALIHARELGESFGATCAEFSTLNKPVITWYGSRERNHIDALGNKGLYYNNYDEIYNIFNKFRLEPISKIDFNCYRDSSPEVVMKKFKKVYLE